MKTISIEPVEVEFIAPYDVELEWEEEKQRLRYKELYQSAIHSDEVIFDDFYAYNY